MQFGFSGQGEPAVARWSPSPAGSPVKLANSLSLSVAHLSWSFSHVPPYFAGCGSIDVFAAPASSWPSGSAAGSTEPPPAGSAACGALCSGAGAAALGVLAAVTDFVACATTGVAVAGASLPAGSSEAPAHALVTMIAP